VILRHLVVKHFNAGDWDEVVKKLKVTDLDTFWRIIASEMTGDDLLKLLDFKLVEDVVASEFNHIIKKTHLLSKRKFISEYT
jgi:hypothetical protein